jgi:hypothetical protein
MGAIDLIHRAVACAVMGEPFLDAGYAHGDRFSRHPHRPAHTGDLEQIG